MHLTVCLPLRTAYIYMIIEIQFIVYNNPQDSYAISGVDLSVIYDKT